MRALAWMGLTVGVALLALPAAAERQHTVRPGETLTAIARGYRVSPTTLAAANARAPDDTLRSGEVLHVPARGVVVLSEGETLWSVARAHGFSVEALARANAIAPDATLRVGTRLVLPSRRGSPRASDTPRATTTAKQGARREPKSKRGGVSARLVRLATNERLRVTLTDGRGRPRPQAAAQLARIMRPRRSQRQKRPDLRLVQRLAEVARRYPGRTIQIVSGYRRPGGYTSKESRHTKGAAIDLRVEGVSERELCDYLRRLPNTGVGLYPNGHFVHLDVRPKSAYWVDLSSPGRKPSYLDREQREHFDGKNKDAGLVELGRSIEATLEALSGEGRPSDG